jgi:hypothetical protein
MRQIYLTIDTLHGLVDGSSIERRERDLKDAYLSLSIDDNTRGIVDAAITLESKNRAIMSPRAVQTPNITAIASNHTPGGVSSNASAEFEGSSGSSSP